VWLYLSTLQCMAAVEGVCGQLFVCSSVLLAHCQLHHLLVSEVVVQEEPSPDTAWCAAASASWSWLGNGKLFTQPRLLYYNKCRRSRLQAAYPCSAATSLVCSSG
jgi:hypothetical protein